MTSFFHSNGRLSLELPKEYSGDDVRLAEDVVEFFVNAYSEPGEVIFDPFSGFGTTLLVAARLGRNAHGIELDPRRVDFLERVLPDSASIQLGDARKLRGASIPAAKLSLSSPPYMQRGDLEDPLSAYVDPVESYDKYLEQLANIYTNVAGLLTADGRLVVQVQNLRNERGVTTLAWDLAHRLNSRLRYDGEIVVTQEARIYGYNHTYCLVYKAAG